MTHDPHDFAREHDAVEPLLAEHALGTIASDERVRVDAHIADCAACRIEFDELSASVAQLEVAAAGGHAPPPAAGARDALLARARRTPQDAARTTVDRTPRRSRRAPTWLAAGLASVACVALALVLVDRQERIESLERRLSDARGDQVPVLRGASIDDLDIGGPFGDSRAQVVLKRDAGIVTFRKVPNPPEEMVWQVWTIDADERIRSIGVIEASRDLAILDLGDVDAEDVERIIVTVEPAGGSDEPTAEEVAGAEV